MNLRALAFVSIVFAVLGGCSLVTSLDGLSGGTTDASSDGSTDATSDADPADAAPSDSGIDAAVVDAGAWLFVTSDAKTSGTAPISVTSSATLRVGDLVVIGCDTSKSGGSISITGFSDSEIPHTSVGPFDDGVNYEAQITWGIVAQPITRALKITAQPVGAVGFIDCTINVYRGGTPFTTQVDVVKDVGPDDSGLVSCGPVSTVPGGLAYYIAARTSCAGLPLNPAFTQRTGINGNPNGDAVPTDGSTLQTQLDACSNSTSAWICLMLSLPP